MTRAQLAEQLRQKLQEMEVLSSDALAGFDDDFLVNAYLNTACKDCGKKLGISQQKNQKRHGDFRNC